MFLRYFLGGLLIDESIECFEKIKHFISLWLYLETYHLTNPTHRALQQAFTECLR
nr:MAG TPA: hypothetical protein [Caudoviricetes sp.]